MESGQCNVDTRIQKKMKELGFDIDGEAKDYNERVLNGYLVEGLFLKGMIFDT